MAKKHFSAVERYAVYTVHGERCYLCGKPIDLQTMQVDHVIPEAIEGTPALVEICVELGLSTTFELQSYENWLPSCGPCNNLKRDTLFKPSPLVQLLLQRAAQKAPKALALEAKAVTQKAVAKAINTLQQAITAGAVDSKVIMMDLTNFLLFHNANRAPERVGKPVLIGPGLELLSEQGGIRVVRGPYGVRSGARCVMCGQMDDD